MFLHPTQEHFSIRSFTSQCLLDVMTPEKQPTLHNTIFFLVSGELSLRQNGTSYLMHPADLFFSALPEPNWSVHEHGPCEGVALHFSSEFIVGIDPEKRLLTLLSKPSAQCGLFSQSTQTCTFSALAMQQLHMLTKQNEIDGYMQHLHSLHSVTTILLSLGDFLKTSMPTHATKHQLRLTRTVEQYIHKNLSESITLDLLAQELYLNKSYISRTFHKVTGMTIGEYIVRKRLLFAQQLLQKGETLADASKAAGFGDYSSFYRAYVKHYHTRPTAKP